MEVLLLIVIGILLLIILALLAKVYFLRRSAQEKSRIVLSRSRKTLHFIFSGIGLHSFFSRLTASETSSKRIPREALTSTASPSRSSAGSAAISASRSG